MSSDDMLRLIDTFKEQKDVKSVCPAIVNCLNAENGTLVQLVEGLQSVLTSPETRERAAGTQLLADVLDQLPRGWLSDIQLTTIVRFMVDRMKDNQAVLPGVLLATTALMEQEHISAVDAELLVRGMQQEVHCQSQDLQTRRCYYSVYRTCFTRHPKVVQSMLNELVLGVVSAADGEKDPRNLLLVFSLVPFVAALKGIDHLVEDLFEVVAAYFPIDFTPPTSDPFGVTEEDLVLSLRQCLASTAVWAQYALPLLLEKLESDFLSAKLDSYKTLESCCAVYRCRHVADHWPGFWKCIKRDVADSPPTSELSRAALLALTALVRAMCRAREEADSADTMLHCLLDECSIHLWQPIRRLFAPSCALLTAAVLGGPLPAHRICDQVIPKLCEQLKSNCSSINNDQQDSSSSSDQHTYSSASNTASVLGQLLAAARHAAAAESASEKQEEVVSVVERHEAACLEALQTALSTSSPALLTAAITAACSALYSPDREAWRTLVQRICRLLLDQAGKDIDVRRTALDALAEPITYSNELLSEILLPLLLKEAAACVCNAESQCNSSIALSGSGNEALAAVLAVTRDSQAVHLVFEKLWPLVKSNCFGAQVLPVLTQVCRNNSADEELQRWLLETWHGLERVQEEIDALASSSAAPGSIVQNLAMFCSALVALNSSASSVAVDRAVALLLKNSSATELPSEEAISRAEHQVYAVQGLLSSARDVSPLSCSVLAPLLGWATLPALPDHAREAAAMLLASILNKAQGEHLDSLSHSLKESLSLLLATNRGREQRVVAVAAWGWFTKALEMRAAQQAQPWMQELQRLLCDPEVGHAAAQCYSILLADQPNCAFANVRLLYKQRVFERVVGGLVLQLESSSGGSRHCTLLAIAALLPHLPHSLLHQHLHSLAGVLVEGVRCSSEPAVLTGSLSSLKRLLETPHPPHDLAPHAAALVPALLALASSAPALAASKRHAGRSSEDHNRTAADDSTDGNQTPTSQAVDPSRASGSDQISSARTRASGSSSEASAAGAGVDSEVSRSSSSGGHRGGEVSSRGGRGGAPCQGVSVRHDSLRCLEMMVALPINDMLPYREQVIRGVQLAVNDHKRVVRRAATSARCAWMLLGAPGT